MFGSSLHLITAGAVAPEQLVHYVRAVSGRRAMLCAGYAAYVGGDHAVLAAYPEAGKLSEATESSHAVQSLKPALDELGHHCQRVTVLAPFIPAEAPPGAVSGHDAYWSLPLPAPPPGQKLRNMLARAGRDVSLAEESWSPEHTALVEQYLASRPLAPGTRAIFTALPRYLGQESDFGAASGGRTALLAARLKNGDLAAFAVGDYTALATAFYMFAFRQRKAPPGTADLLLAGLIDKAEQLGHQRMNLGLAVNGGIAFFKQKWGAHPFLPYVESSWSLKKERRGFFSSLRKR